MNPSARAPTTPVHDKIQPLVDAAKQLQNAEKKREDNAAKVKESLKEAKRRMARQT